jgi:flagellar hook-associated protein 2
LKGGVKMSDKLRITGLATGLDVDSMVKTMMKAENVKLDKLKQEKQILQWKQDMYREILGDLNTFKSTYFDVLKPDTYMLSLNNYSAFDVTSVDSGSSTATPSVTATAGTGAVAGTYEVSNVTLATKATSSGSVKNIAQADNAITFPLSIADADKNFVVKVNGTSYNITLTVGTYNTIDDLVSDIKTKLQTISDNGSNRVLDVQKSPDGTKIQFVAGTENGAPGGNAVSINISNASGSTALSKLGFTATSFDVNQTVNNKMSMLFNGSATFTLNGKNFNYDFSSTGAHKDWTISQVLNDISSQAGVSVTYSELARKFTISSNTTGSNQSLSVAWTNDANNTDKFLALFGISSGTGSFTVNGTDAKATIKNPNGATSTVVKSANTFTIDGVTYNLQSNNSSTTTKITLTSNTQKVFDKIKAFIDKYNEIIDKIQTKITQKKQYDYKPLTDEQKKEMKEDEIKIWEEKAKEGLLKNDSMLQNMIYSLRRAFYDSVEGAGISLTDIGLSTDSDYSKGGRIIIDEAKLKDAIQNRGEQVIKLFIKDSEIKYDPNHKTDKDRYKNVGIFQRINDILKDYTRTTRDDKGKKGILIETAGIKGDLSEFENMISKQIKNDYDKRISDLTEKLTEKENKYYEQFSKLEVAMQKLNDQSNWLYQQLGFGGR